MVGLAWSSFVLLGAVVGPARAAIAAWSTENGPQIVLQNETTGHLRYSACNTYDEARYSYTDPNVLSLTYKPKNGTPLAGSGWWNEITTIASVFYITESNRIANAIFHCNMTTGFFLPQGNWIVSDDVPSIHNSSGLAVLNLGAEAGYRVYYHDEDGAVNELAYYNNLWRYRGPISKDIGSPPALGAAFSNAENITVVAARDAETIGVTRWNKDETWFHTSMPRPLEGGYTTKEVDRQNITVNSTAPYNFTLPAWDGMARSLGASINADYTRHIWYIGHDSNLHLVTNMNWTWGIRENQTEEFWPKADKPNADLAVTHLIDSSVVRIYYFVKGKLAEVRYQDDEWKPYSVVEAPDPIATTAPTPDGAGEDSGLSTGAKVGIGIGVSLGAISIGAIIAVLVLLHRKKKEKALAEQEHQPPSDPYPADGSTTLEAGTPYQAYGASAQGWTPDDKPSQLPTEPLSHQLDSNPRSELDCTPKPIYELPGNERLHELVADGPKQQGQPQQPGHGGERAEQEKSPGKP
ncbi:hypothetical protein VTJ83DRAFT_3903 [Remersonia thermophila]|uniref:Fucose-specific lectin n=1 Tax=Remersonia thermophila TaxID=72144 RepID=A0ABR4DHJ0_9PEZI